MAHFSTRQAAKKLGISITSLDRYITAKKVPAPKATVIGRYEVRAWSEEDIERVRTLLPKIANGRKTRYQKQKSVHGTLGSSKVRSQKSAKAKARSKPKSSSRKRKAGGSKP